MPLCTAQASMISATTRASGDCAGAPRSLTISSRAEGAHRGELEPHIGLVGKAGIARDLSVDLLAPAAQLVGRDRPVEVAGDDLGDQFADLRAARCR